MIAYNTIYDFVRECEAAENINLINLAVICGDDVLARLCKKPYKEECKQLLFSMTKSFTSLAVGIACDKGLLHPDDHVITYFSDQLPGNPHVHLKQMRLSHLLTMTSGIHDNTYAELFAQPNWIVAFLTQDFPHKPGTYYRYSTHATHMLSAVIEKVSGQNLADFLNVNMFYPMGIRDAQWEHSPEGFIAGGMGLSLRPSDLEKVSIMLLNRGMYNDRRIVSEDYLSLATSFQAIKQDDKNNANAYFSGFEYGYQFHVMPSGAYRADGAFGQFCIVDSKRNIAVISTSQRTKTESFLAMVDKYFFSSSYDSSKSISKEFLNEYLHQLSFLPTSKKAGEKNPIFSNSTYRLEDNALNIKSIKISNTHIIFGYNNDVYDKIEFDCETPVYGFSHFTKDLQVHLQEHCVLANFPDSNTLLLTVYYIETPYVAQYSLKFIEEKLTFDFNVNVSLTLKNFSVSGFTG